MANRTVAKKKNYGYMLLINRSGEKGERNWNRVGEAVFGSKYEAETYRAKHHANMKFLVKGINLDPRPVVFVSEEKGKK